MIKSKNFEDVLNIAREKNKKLYEICELLEADTSEISTEEVRDRVKIILDAMKDAIEKGLKSKEKSIRCFLKPIKKCSPILWQL